MTDVKFISVKDIRKKYNISSNALRVWAESGKIRCIRPNGTRRLYNSEDIKRIFNDKASRNTILYARVSSGKQKEDLERQEEKLKKMYPDCEILSDIGSGLNWKRKSFNTILERIIKGDIEKLVVTYRDRLCRFGFELFEKICILHNTEIVVLNKVEDDKDGTGELQEDLLAIITFFTARAHGKRRNKNSD